MRRWRIPLFGGQGTIDTHHLTMALKLTNLSKIAAYAFGSSWMLSNWRGPYGLPALTTISILLKVMAERHALSGSILPSPPFEIGTILYWVTGGELSRFTSKQWASAPNESNLYVRFWIGIYEQAYTRIYVGWLFRSIAWSLMLIILYWGPALIESALFLAVNLFCHFCIGVAMMLMLLGVCFLLILIALVAPCGPYGPTNRFKMQ